MEEEKQRKKKKNKGTEKKTPKERDPMEGRT